MHQLVKYCWYLTGVREMTTRLRGLNTIWLAEEIYDMLRVNNHQFKAKCRDVPVVQWLRVCASKTGGPGSNHAQGTRSYMLQLKIPCAATKTWHSQINNFLKTAKCKRQKTSLGVFSSVQLLSCVRLFATPCTAAHQASLSITNSQSLLKLMLIESMMPSKHLILCCPLLLLPSIFPSIRVFSDESALHIRWPKDQSISFNISPSNEYSGLISLRMDWWDFLAGQGTLKSLLQHHSSKASILWCSAFFIVQL